MLAVPAAAQPKKKVPPTVAETPKPADPKKADDKNDKKGAEPPVIKKANGDKEQNFKLDGFTFTGKNHSPQLLYFLERANEELERASLQKRSFIPHLVRSLEEEAL
ncbi:MAG: hypothetical protein KF773_15635 [Deltaproteobacteria bacterium]|nr:hypothetical protein [Deltaproteobacteria bacterium]